MDGGGIGRTEGELSPARGASWGSGFPVGNAGIDHISILVDL